MATRKWDDVIGEHMSEEDIAEARRVADGIVEKLVKVRRLAEAGLITDEDARRLLAEPIPEPEDA